MQKQATPSPAASFQSPAQRVIEDRLGQQAESSAEERGQPAGHDHRARHERTPKVRKCASAQERKCRQVRVRSSRCTGHGAPARSTCAPRHLRTTCALAHLRTYALAHMRTVHLLEDQTIHLRGSFRSRKSSMSAAMSSPLSSSAKWPVSSRCTPRRADRAGTDGAPSAGKITSFFPQTMRVGGWRERKNAWNWDTARRWCRSP